MTTSLAPVRFFTADDRYHYSVENRPLSDLATRDQQLATALDDLQSQVTAAGIGPNSIRKSQVISATATATITIDTTTFVSQYNLDLSNPTCVVTISSAIPVGQAWSFRVYVIPNANGQTVTWPVSVIWVGGTAPTIAGLGSGNVLDFTTYPNDPNKWTGESKGTIVIA